MLTNFLIALAVILWIIAGYTVLHVNDKPVHIHRSYPQMIG